MKNLVIYLILSAMVLNISPGNNYRKYISLFTGLVLIIMLARPVAAVLDMDWSKLEWNEVTGDGMNMDIEQYLADKPDYSILAQQRQMCDRIEEEGIKVEDVEITRDREGRVIRLIIYMIIEDNENESVIERARSLAAEQYNVDISDVYIVRR